MKLTEEIMKLGVSENLAEKAARCHLLLERSAKVAEIAELRHLGLSNEQICKILDIHEETMKTLMAE